MKQVKEVEGRKKKKKKLEEGQNRNKKTLTLVDKEIVIIQEIEVRNKA